MTGTATTLVLIFTGLATSAQAQAVGEGFRKLAPAFTASVLRAGRVLEPTGCAR